MSTSFNRLTFSLIILISCLSLSGCFLAPFIQSFKEVGATQSDREALLVKAMKKYSESLYWDNSGSMVKTSDEIPASVKGGSLLAAKNPNERIVESKVSNVVFGEGAYSADVEFMVRYYKIPYYVVQERKEDLKWKFSVGEGWTLVDRSMG